ncbi:MAG: Gfo/Idh/MocA family oxidoreductase [Calothrix sp. C42_A2020_038]|nr:Gfo/Idh/MocA family oxidoreductase [Calothrix sp. C42_A2020_038]
MLASVNKYVAVIGCGYWGKNLVRDFAQLGVLRVICDAKESVLADLSAKFSVEGVSNFDTVLAMSDVKAVIIATPAPTHAKLVIKALNAGKDVFVEKPLALTLEDALLIETTTRKKNQVLMVGHLLEYHPALVKLRSLVAAGKIGKLRYIYSNRLSFGKVRTEENVLLSFAPHDICSILGFTGKLPISVQAVGSANLTKVEDFCLINLEFENNIKAHIFTSWLHPFKEQRLVVIGDSGTLVFDDVSTDAKLTFYDQKAEIQDNIPVLKLNSKTVISIDTASPLTEECKHFLTCVETRQTPKTDIQNGINVLKVLQSAQLSLESQGKTVSLKELQLVYL